MNNFGAELARASQTVNRAPEPNAFSESMLGQLLGESSWTALKFYIRRMYGLDVTASRIAVEKPEAFENILFDLFGICSATVLKPLVKKMLQAYPVEAFIEDADTAGGQESDDMQYQTHGDFARIMNIIAEKYNVRSVITSYPDGSHVAVAYTTTEELRALIRSFVQKGNEKNRLNVINLSDREYAEFEDLIAEENLLSIEQGATYIQQPQHPSFGGIVLRHLKSDIFAACSDSMDYFGLVQSMMVPLEAVMKLQGKSGISLVGTFTGHLHSKGYGAEASSLEKSWMEFVDRTKDYPLTVVCPYRMPLVLDKSMFANHTSGGQCCGSNWMQAL